MIASDWWNIYNSRIAVYKESLLCRSTSLVGAVHYCAFRHPQSFVFLKSEHGAIERDRAKHLTARDSLICQELK